MADIRISQYRHTYPSVGRCIYCGSLKELTDEHIIPYSLGGNLLLPQASCKPCAAITGNLEGVVGRPIYGPMRAFYEIQKRRRPAEQTIRFLFETERGQESREIPVADCPPVLFLRVFDKPAIFSGAPLSPLIQQLDNWIWYSHEFTDYVERLRKPGDKEWAVDLVFNGAAFARVVAKISHGMAVAVFGLENFKPFLTGLIRGEDKNIGYLVGGASPPTEPTALPQGTQLVRAHEVTIEQVKRAGTGERLLVATVRLFPFTGAPSYCAVVGEPGPKIIEQLG